MAEGQPTEGARRGRGFRRAARLIDARIRQAGKARGFAVSRLLTHWDEIVGVEIASLARPVKIHYGRGSMGATLTLLATGAAAPLVQMRIPRIMERVNACYGHAAIARISITQTAAAGLAQEPARGFAERAAPFAPAPKSEPATDGAAEARARAASADVADPALRAALERLGARILVERPRKERDA